MISGNCVTQAPKENTWKERLGETVNIQRDTIDCLRAILMEIQPTPTTDGCGKTPEPPMLFEEVFFRNNDNTKIINELTKVIYEKLIRPL